LVISRSVFLRMRNFSKKLYRKSKHILCSLNFFFRKSCLFLDNVKNNVQPGRPQITIWPMHIACWIPKATTTPIHIHTHTRAHRICNTPTFLVPQWLHEDAPMLRHSYFACLSKSVCVSCTHKFAQSSGNSSVFIT